MDRRNNPFEDSQASNEGQVSDRKAVNPFTNSQPVDKDIEQSQEEVNKEQQFKEALTERD